MTGEDPARSTVVGVGVLLVIVLASAVASAQVARSPDSELGSRLAQENRKLPEFEAFFFRATSETDRFIRPLLQSCALENCFLASMSNSYLLRIRSDGTIGDAFIEPSNRFTDCVASGLKARARLASVPPTDDYWISWTASGIMRLPEACSAEMVPPVWYTLTWWLFIVEDWVPRHIVLRVKALFIAAALTPFLLTVGAWKLLRPDAGIRSFIRRLAAGGLLLLLAAASSFVVGLLAKESREDNRMNVALTVLVTFPLLASTPFAWEGLRDARRAASANARAAAIGRIRRGFGGLLLIAAISPAAGFAWFGIHENVYRFCPSCVEPFKVSWLSLL